MGDLRMARRCNCALDLPDVSKRFRGASHPCRRLSVTLHGVVFDILVGSEFRVGLAAGKRGLPSRSLRATPAFAQEGFGVAAFTRFASEGWWACLDSNQEPDRYER